MGQREHRQSLGPHVSQGSLLQLQETHDVLLKTVNTITAIDGFLLNHT